MISSVAVEVIVPEVGEAGMEVTLVRWLRSEGDYVQEGEPLFELDTEKSTVEIEAFAEGRLADLQVSEGDTVEPKQVVAVLVPEGEEM